MSLSFDIAAAIVGFLTLALFYKQLHDQKSLSTRLADLQYCKMMEDKLLAIIYKIKMGEQIHSVPTLDWYKFHFLRGKIIPDRSNGQNANYHIFVDIKKYEEFTEEAKKEYTTSYSDLIEGIKTEDLRKFYKNSQFQEVFELFNKK